MSKIRDRKCIKCGEVKQNTRTRAEICDSCENKQKKLNDSIKELAQLKEWGYMPLEGPWEDKHKHRCYKVLTPCNHEWTAPYINMKKQINNAISKDLRQACGICGPSHRTKKALTGYLDKHARDYDIKKFNGYKKEVRVLSEITYNDNLQLINPNNYKRGLAGVDGAYHLDHKVPIIKCFKEGWLPEKAAELSNLQMLSWIDNLTKSGNCIVLPIQNNTFCVVISIQ